MTLRRTCATAMPRRGALPKLLWANLFYLMNFMLLFYFYFIFIVFYCKLASRISGTNQTGESSCCMKESFSRAHHMLKILCIWPQLSVETFYQKLGVTLASNHAIAIGPITYNEHTLLFERINDRKRQQRSTRITGTNTLQHRGRSSRYR